LTLLDNFGYILSLINPIKETLQMPDSIPSPIGERPTTPGFYWLHYLASSKSSRVVELTTYSTKRPVPPSQMIITGNVLRKVLDDEWYDTCVWEGPLQPLSTPLAEDPDILLINQLIALADKWVSPNHQTDWDKLQTLTEYWRNKNNASH
jgi:hypothetical protein